MADTKTPEQKSVEKTSASSIQRIPSRAKRKFLSDGGAIVNENDPFVFIRTKDNFYPYPILEPDDESLDEELEAEYKSARKAINDEAAKKNAGNLAEVLTRMSKS